MTDSPHRMNSGACRIKAPILASILMTIGGWALPATAGDVSTARSAEEVRQDLYELVKLQQSLLETYKKIQVVDPRFIRTAKLQTELISLMSPQELMMLAEADLPLSDLNAALSEDITELALSIKDAKPIGSYSGKSEGQSSGSTGLDPNTSGAPHMDNQECLDESNDVDPNTAVNKPPGYCNQTDMIPISYDDVTRQATTQEYRLSDGGYPTVCPRNYRPETITYLENVHTGLEIINQVSGKICQQEAAGFNGSTACVVFVLALRLAERLLSDVGYCNGVRRNSDGGTIYTRLGEIFVQGNAHYEALSTTNDFIQTATTELDTNVGGNITKMGDEVSADLENNIGNVESKIAEIQPTIDENAAKLSFAQSNNAAIEYKIWCDKQRPYLRPSDCE